MQSSPQLLRAASQLKHAAPQEWEEFVKLFFIHTEEVTVAVTAAEPSTILVEQGKAQHARALLRIFIECDMPKLPLKRPT